MKGAGRREDEKSFKTISDQSFSLVVSANDAPCTSILNKVTKKEK